MTGEPTSTTEPPARPSPSPSPSPESPESPSAPARSARAIVFPALAGGAVALSLGVYGRVHQATFDPIFDLGFPSLQAMKSWLATIAVAFAVFQIVSAFGMWGKLPFWRPAAQVAAAGSPVVRHLRLPGVVAGGVPLPVGLGFQADAGLRPFVHSVLGCAFYGAFSTKLLALRNDRLPSWGIPVVGATLVVLLTGLWLTSSLWFFTTVDFPALP